MPKMFPQRKERCFALRICRDLLEAINGWFPLGGRNGIKKSFGAFVEVELHYICCFLLGWKAADFLVPMIETGKE